MATEQHEVGPVGEVEYLSVQIGKAAIAQAMILASGIGVMAARPCMDAATREALAVSEECQRANGGGDVCTPEQFNAFFAAMLRRAADIAEGKK